MTVFLVVFLVIVFVALVIGVVVISLPSKVLSDAGSKMANRDVDQPEESS